jgi:hypothetical protein
MGNFIAAALFVSLVLAHWLAGRWGQREWRLLSQAYPCVSVNKPDFNSYDGIAIPRDSGVSPAYKYRFKDNELIICRQRSGILPLGSQEHISVPLLNCVFELENFRPLAILMVDVPNQKACFRLSPNSQTAARRLEGIAKTNTGAMHLKEHL